MAENLDRTGGRVVDCSGLENRTAESPEVPKMAHSLDMQAAQDATFAGCSAARDGAQVGTVYFVRAGNAHTVKIGYARDADVRLRQLQTASPTRLRFLLRLPGDWILEQQLHDQFREYRVRGEWFRLSDEIKAFIFKNGGPYIFPAGSFSKETGQ